MERAEKLELVFSLKPGPWRLSVKKELWPDFAQSHPHPRVFGKFTRWVKKPDRIRVDWPDGVGSTTSTTCSTTTCSSRTVRKASPRRTRLPSGTCGRAGARLLPRRTTGARRT
jgi:hypothetical protein